MGQVKHDEIVNLKNTKTLWMRSYRISVAQMDHQHLESGLDLIWEKKLCDTPESGSVPSYEIQNQAAWLYVRLTKNSLEKLHTWDESLVRDFIQKIKETTLESLTPEELERRLEMAERLEIARKLIEEAKALRSGWGYGLFGIYTPTGIQTMVEKAPDFPTDYPYTAIDISEIDTQIQCAENLLQTTAKERLEISSNRHEDIKAFYQLIMTTYPGRDSSPLTTHEEAAAESKVLSV